MAKSAKKIIEREVMDLEGKALAKRFEPIRSRAAFAKQHGLNPTMIQQHLTSERPISLDYAKKYAAAFGCNLIDISERLYEQIKDASEFIEKKEGVNFDNKNNHDVSHDEIVINQFHDVRASMGGGLLLRGETGQITGWKVNHDWMNKNVPANTGNKNLSIVTGFGDSMRGMFNSGDPLLVDAGVTSLDYDGVYFFRIGDEGFIKTLQRIPNEGIRVISENKKYESWTITKDMDFEVFARVLKVWKSEEF
jgi:phage repressor protein C with HTH and peptisase S24 domain